MKNKRGFLLGEETVKIVISIIGLIFLIIILFSLYYNNTGDYEAKQAKASLERLVKEIEALEESKNPSGDYVWYSPSSGNVYGWYLTSWPRLGTSLLPKTCSSRSLKKCLCACRGALAITDSQIADVCDKFATCLEIPANWDVEQTFSLSSATVRNDIIGLENPPKKIILDNILKEIR